MILLNVMKEIGTRLDTIAGLRVFDFPSDTITPPAAIVAYPDSIEYDATYGRGMDRLTLPVLLMVGKANDRAARNNLVPYADGSGGSSVKAVLESGSYTAFDEVRVMSCEFDVVRLAAGDFAAALFDLDIAGDGGS